MNKIIMLIVAGAFLAVGSAQAQIIAAWDVSGDSSPATLPADSVLNPNLASGSAVLGRTGLGQNAGANSFNSNNWNIGTFDETDKYIGFTLTPQSGYEMTITSLQFAMNGSNTAPGQGRWGYRIGSGSFTTFDFTLANPLPSSLATWDITDFTTDQTVEFRFWAFGATSINGGSSATGGTVRIANISGDDLVVNGSVALIPEPSTYLLLALGLGTLVFLRRKRVNA